METPSRKRVRVGDLLLEKSLISEDQLHQALAEQKKTGKSWAGRLLIWVLLKKMNC